MKTSESISKYKAIGSVQKYKSFHSKPNGNSILITVLNLAAKSSNLLLFPISVSIDDNHEVPSNILLSRDCNQEISNVLLSENHKNIFYYISTSNLSKN